MKLIILGVKTMLLYHGSSTGGIRILKPRLADHDRPYVYLSTIEIAAAFYMVNAVARPYYWFPYGFSKSGNAVYHELYPHAIEEVSSGKTGYIYTVDAEENTVLPFKNIPCARLGTAPMNVRRCEEIRDCYTWFLQQENSGKFMIARFEQMTESQINWWHNDIFEYIKEKDMIRTPDCSYAEFIRRKFPGVWERYEREQR
jgi:hypothetical protein